MALFNNLVSPLRSRYWLRFQESYENVISSLKTSSATSPLHLAMQSSAGALLLCLWPHTSPFWFCLLFSSSCSLYPIPCTQLLSETVFTDYKRSCEEKEARRKETIQGKQTKAERKLLNYAWLCFIKDFMVRLQYHFSLERSEDRFIYSLPHSCVQSNRKHVPLDKRLSIFKNVQRTQALLPLALEKCPFECSCCWSWEDCARLSA